MAFGQNAAEFNETLEAAQQGHAEVQFSLGLMYHQGNGVKQDYALAQQWYEKAAQQGDVVAQFGLGIIYLNGLGTRQNTSQAKAYFG